MGLTSAQYDTLIESARLALQTALDNPKPNYTIGSRTVSFADYIKTLSDNLEKIIAMQAGLPAESIKDYDYDITNTGADNTQYEGDENV